MNVLEITPPKQLKFSLPGDMQRVLTLTNLTLHSVFVLILNSHPYEISLSHKGFTLQAFEERKVALNLNWVQEAINLSEAKIRVYYQEVEEESTLENLQRQAYYQNISGSYEELQVQLSLEGKEMRYLAYQEQEESPVWRNNEKKIYQLRRISPPIQTHQTHSYLINSEELRNQVLSYLQHLPEVMSIEPCQLDGSFLIEFAANKEEACSFIEFNFQEEHYVYAFSRIAAYGYPLSLPPLLSLQEESPQVPEKLQNTAEGLSRQKKQTTTLSPTTPPNQQQAKSKENNVSQIKRESSLTGKVEQRKAFKKNIIKQSFAAKREETGKTKRRVRSEQKIAEVSSDEENGLMKDEIMELQQVHKKKERDRQKQAKVTFKESKVELTQKILGIWVQEQEGSTEVYVVTRECVRCFVLEEPLARKSIKFDPIYEENVGLPCPIDRYKDQLIFGNESTLYWVNIVSGEAEWKYVQRKDIYCLSVIEELSLVAVGGRSYSKLSYFGKSTGRSNLKLYSCSSADKHDHLFTYDIPGQNVGNVMSMVYVGVPPHGIRLLLVHTFSNNSSSSLFFLRVKAFNKIEIYGQIDLDELGIINLLRLKASRSTSRIVCLESLGEGPQIDCFKRLKLRCQYEKVEVSTEGIKVPLQQYICFHLGGSQNSQEEWMSLVERNGSVCHVFSFESGRLQTFQLGKGQIRQMFWLRGGRYILLSSEFTLSISERIEEANY